jgi:excisionase family DNA binding protein
MAARDKKVPAGSSPVMTAAEVCAFLRIHRSTLHRLIKAGAIPFFRMGSDFRVNREAIDEWRQSQGYPAPPKPDNG